ncbi:MAG: RNA polymerase factor sigma-54 [Deltaproteobacteria bacterium]|nr:RNA polymerase factor sigma-54 [Deltaproteobacteria bacterium]
MALETKLVQKLSQSLLMTPQLQQAIKLLQLGRLEYIEAIQKELLENPILEEIKEGPEEPTFTASPNGTSPDGIEELRAPAESESEPSLMTGKTPVDWENYLENLTDARGSSTPRGFADLDDKPSLEATLTKSESLYDHLVSQLRMADIDREQLPVVMHIVCNLNRDGYLCCSHEEIAEAVGCSLEQVEKAMEIVKTLEPAGIAARDLRECLLMQLHLHGLGDSLEWRIVSEHLDKLERKKYDQIAKSEKVSLDEVYKAVQAIQHLEPRPGRIFSDETVRYIIPDIYVYKVDGEYVISLNEDGMPKLRVSSYYLKLLKGSETNGNPHKEYLNERLKAASWLIKSIHQRQQTIFRVTESIVKFQKNFFDYGIEKLKPLVLKDVADDIGMHESTVSRVTTNKYVHTPQGVFELKFFFSTGIKTGDGDVSSSTIKEKIKQIIASETPDKPISDQQIVDMLKSANIEIARRTVAKYRESLGILSSSKRKKVF